MKQRKMAHHVSVKTIPNGYAMDVDGTGYMYYTMAELVEGFFVHVGIGIVDFCDKDTMRDLITACGTFPKEGHAIQAVAGLQAKIEALEQSHRRDFREIETRKLQNLKLAEELQKTKKRLNYYLSEEKAAKAKAEAEEKKVQEGLVKGTTSQRRCDDRKKIIKVKPWSPIDKDKPEKVGRPKKYAKYPELEEKLRKRGVIK